MKADKSPLIGIGFHPSVLFPGGQPVETCRPSGSAMTVPKHALILGIVTVSLFLDAVRQACGRRGDGAEGFPFR